MGGKKGLRTSFKVFAQIPVTKQSFQMGKLYHSGGVHTPCTVVVVSTLSGGGVDTQWWCRHTAVVVSKAHSGGGVDGTQR